MKPLDNSEAISPVIGIVILLGVTVIISAAIGIFVIGIGQNNSAGNINTDSFLLVEQNADGSIDGQLRVGEIENLRLLVDGNEKQNFTNVSVGDTINTPRISAGSRVTFVSGSGDNASIIRRVTVKPELFASFNTSPDFPNATEPVTFNASDSLSPGGEITEYNWNFAVGLDGTTENNGSVETTHAYARPGQYDAVLTIVNENGTTDSVVEAVNVEVIPPNTSFDFSPSIPNVGEQVTFTGSADDPDGTTESFKWEFDNGNTADERTTTQTFESGGSFLVNFTATDNDNASNTTTERVFVNKPPNASFDTSSTSATTEETIEFNSTSGDSDGSISEYEWTFGDGTTQSGTTLENITHTYNDDGLFDANLTVTDDNGAETTATKEVTVSNVAPRASFDISPSENITTGETIDFNSTSADSDGSINNYEWTFGDGNQSETENTTHTYSSSGDYTVTLNVTDDDSASDEETQTVSVNTPPTAAFSFTPSNPNTGETVSFTDESEDPDGDSLDYQWDLDNGSDTNSTESDPEPAYSTGGDKTVTLTVTDGNGGTDTTTQTVSVNSPPTASFSFSPSSPETNETVSFNGGNSTDDGTINNYDWTFNNSNGTTASGESIDVVFDEPGDYEAKLTVTDDAGVTNVTSKIFTVSGVSYNSDNVTIE